MDSYWEEHREGEQTHANNQWIIWLRHDEELRSNYFQIEIARDESCRRNSLKVRNRWIMISRVSNASLRSRKHLFTTQSRCLRCKLVSDVSFHRMPVAAVQEDDAGLRPWVPIAICFVTRLGTHVFSSVWIVILSWSPTASWSFAAFIFLWCARESCFNGLCHARRAQHMYVVNGLVVDWCNRFI